MYKDVVIHKEIKKSDYPRLHSKIPFYFRVVQNLIGIASKIAPGMTTKVLLTKFYKPSDHRPNSKNGQTFFFKINQKDLFLNKNDQKVHLDLHGEGRKVLFCHGWGGIGDSFYRFIDPLVASGYQFILVDFPAHGLSSGTESSIFDFISTIELIIKELGPIYALVGHSVGGLAAMNVLAKNHNITKSIIISCPASIKSVVGTYKRMLKLSDKVIRKLMDNIEQKFEISIPEKSIHGLNSHLKSSTLIFHDKYDSTIPYEDGILIEQKWLNSKFISTIGLGHHRILRDETVISESIDFLNK